MTAHLACRSPEFLLEFECRTVTVPLRLGYSCHSIRFGKFSVKMAGIIAEMDQ